MADEVNQSNTQTPTESTPGQIPPTQPPQIPAQGAAVAAPLTGGGARKAESAHQPAAAPTNKPPQTPQHPVRHPSRPKLPQSSNAQQENKSKQPQQYPASQQSVAFTQPTVPVHDPAVASLLAKTLNNQKSAAQQFFMVELPEDDWPQLHSFSTIEELVSAIKERLGSNCHLFPFMGHKLSITAGQHRFLHTPYGPLPLFDIPDPQSSEETEYGWVGSDSMTSLTAQVVETEDTDEEFYAEADDAEDGSDGEEFDDDTTPMFGD